jgi:hypothetical protein
MDWTDAAAALDGKMELARQASSLQALRLVERELAPLFEGATLEKQSEFAGVFEALRRKLGERRGMYLVVSGRLGVWPERSRVLRFEVDMHMLRDRLPGVAADLGMRTMLKAEEFLDLLKPKPKRRARDVLEAMIDHALEPDRDDRLASHLTERIEHEIGRDFAVQVYIVLT